ncbi:MAG: hypothetical protein ASARMPREDX12_008258 [Alectoria sarmentosa]|nr:MAG: hypothetical protein ASARMPREDX12_008258 [Alectoria sarmentosa]
MSDRGSDFDSRRQHRRRYSSESEPDRRRSARDMRRRSSDRPRPADKTRASTRDEPRSDHRRNNRSRSPRPDRRRENRERVSRSSRSPPRRPRDDDRRVSNREYGASRSPPPPNHDSRDRRRHSNHRTERGNPSPPPRRRSPTPPPAWTRAKAPLPSQQAAFDQNPTSDDDGAVVVIKPPGAIEKQKPNYAATGKLAAETNTVAHTSIVLKYNEPPESRLPPSSAAWRLYVFKGAEVLETLPIHERSCWLFGRERAVVDFPIEHPSCSKQHAVLQFRYTEKRDEWGGKKGGVKPYVIDLESANGTRVNGEAVPERRFVEVRSGDVVRFGESTRLVGDILDGLMEGWADAFG